MDQNNNNNMEFENLKDQVLNPQDVSDQFTAEDINANKWYAVAATFPILFWLPIAVSGNSAYGKFYANQGLIELILVIVLNVLNMIVGRILRFIPFIGGLLSSVVGLAVGLCILAVWLFLVVNALNGKAKEIPIVGGLFKAFN